MNQFCQYRVKTSKGNHVVIHNSVTGKRLSKFGQVGLVNLLFQL